MKIILAAKSVHPFHPFGGVQKYVYYFAKHLLREGADLEIVAPLDNGRPRLERYEGISYRLLSPAIYSYLEYPIGWLGVHLFSRVLSRYLQTIDFDLLHAFDMTGFQYLRVKNRRPVISHIFSDNYLVNPIATKNPLNFFNLAGYRVEQIKQEKVGLSPFSEGALKRQYWLQYLFKTKPMHFCLKRSEAVFFEAEQFREEAGRIFQLDSSRDFVIPVGVDIDFIESCLRDSTMTRKDLGLNEEDVVLLTVNRLAADKGIDKIILALAEIRKIYPSVKLVIIGSGYQERELYEIVEAKGLKDSVMHLKAVDEKKLYNFYKLSNIYVSAFSYAGSSISTLEAMACSLPIITSAQPWLVDGNGIALLDNAPDHIASAVAVLIREGRLREMGGRSRELVEDYNWPDIVKKAVGIYNNSLRQGIRI